MKQLKPQLAAIDRRQMSRTEWCAFYGTLRASYCQAVIDTDVSFKHLGLLEDAYLFFRARSNWYFWLSGYRQGRFLTHFDKIPF